MYNNIPYYFVDARKQWLLYITRELLWRYKRLNQISNYFEITRSLTIEFYTQQN